MTTASRQAQRTWTISELAQEYAVSLRTIRFYEDQGLLSPERRGNQRVFHARDRVRLGLILRGKRLGFSLREIAHILDMYDAEPGEVGQLRYLLDQIAVRRAELEQRRRDIEATLAELDEVERRCRADLRRLERQDRSGRRKRSTDSAGRQGRSARRRG
ncbi:MerR family transcriptional regulator [Thermasporomyces composti]|jgi:DNA-binding transcriptional MerR regulator|uniref:DNA-binding transcriptional MerR regulator n=1 Tax=Thermasporomyces composti TaxID=696763 RepID=A0A3D9VH01_THECX|nr:MerR family DNA-binding transcriptional regulator [Thermasporomyces composti]REF37464.1 DNA-binding transcriptional MerR regulator [Thermasporomyces composti]